MADFVDRLQAHHEYWANIIYAAGRVDPPLNELQARNLQMYVNLQTFLFLIANLADLLLPENADTRRDAFRRSQKMQLFYSRKPRFHVVNNYHPLMGVLETYRNMYPD